ncbi:adenylyl cyclase-associated protein 1-like [Patiria miniata]|uniref:C-CAP/cofactor C-like domain-containing protein n=1 Tax=Patiria miniata TaxID=46514 RepID=A0A913ZM91_PATMI|nr:adenylyl cyclase-associated protein 1-like [Patiria miniata]XP_038052181.1 adenylyl cyclase-associated protein 1-like [Patiria miniata]
MADALVSQLATLSGNLKSEADKIDEVTAKKLNDAIIVLQGVARRASGDTPPFVSAFDDFISEHVAKYLNLSQEIGGVVYDHAKLVEKCYNLQREYLHVAANSKRPSQKDYGGFFQPLQVLVEDVIKFADKNRTNKERQNHLMTVKEGIGCIGWVTVEPKPGMYLKEMYDQSLFYGNRVIKEYRGKDDKQVEWMRSFTNAIMRLKDFVDNYLNTGVTWNPQGKAPVAPGGGAAAGPPPPPGGAPPPPPPPAVEAPTAAGASSQPTAAAALFADINKGEGVTTGLKKVTADMQTHKNPALRQGAKPFSGAAQSGVKAVSAPKVPAKAVVKPPRLELIAGKKWEVEYQKDKQDIVIEGQMMQTIYIYKCENSVIQVKNKVNLITLDSCKKTGLVLDQCMGSVDTVNCQSVKLQVTGKVPIVSIDKTDGAMLYLSPDSLDTIVVAAKSSEMNVLIPKGDGDYTEFPLPEQFKSTYNGKTFVTACNDSLG